MMKSENRTFQNSKTHLCNITIWKQCSPSQHIYFFAKCVTDQNKYISLIAITITTTIARQTGKQHISYLLPFYCHFLPLTSLRLTHSSTGRHHKKIFHQNKKKKFQLYELEACKTQLIFFKTTRNHPIQTSGKLTPFSNLHNNISPVVNR